MDKINANIKFIRKQKGLTQQAFANLIGIKRSSLGAYEEGRAKPNYKTIENIAKKFNISIEKLFTQDLAQIAEASVFGTSTPLPTEGKDITGKSLRVLSITVDKDNNENIELVPVKAAAGYLEGYSDPNYLEKLPKFRLPFLNTGTYRAFEIKGDSMLPLQPGSVVVGEYVEDWNYIKDGQTCIVVSSSEGIVYKRIVNKIKKDGSLILRSDNMAYPPYAVKVDELAEIWVAKAFISKDMPTTDVSLEKLMLMVMDLQQEVFKLKDQVNVN